MNEVPKWSMPTLFYHEGVPGHHWQISIAHELKGLPQFRKVIPFTAYMEGWAFTANGWPSKPAGTKVILLAIWAGNDVTFLTNHHLRVISSRADNICPKPQEYFLAMRKVPADTPASRSLADSTRRRASPGDSSCPRIRLHHQE